MAYDTMLKVKKAIGSLWTDRSKMLNNCDSGQVNMFERYPRNDNGQVKSFGAYLNSYHKGDFLLVNVLRMKKLAPLLPAHKDETLTTWLKKSYNLVLASVLATGID